MNTINSLSLVPLKKRQKLPDEFQQFLNSVMSPDPFCRPDHSRNHVLTEERKAVFIPAVQRALDFCERGCCDVQVIVRSTKLNFIEKPHPDLVWQLNCRNGAIHKLILSQGQPWERYVKWKEWMR